MKDEQKIRMIPIDRIRVLNPRSRDPKKFDRIVENIRLVGLKRPITVAAATKDGEEVFNLVCGQGRLEAFVALGEKEIPALVRGISKQDSLIASLVENIARRRVRGVEQVRMIQWMDGRGHSHAEIARKTGLTAEYVKVILNMLAKGEERLLGALLHEKIPMWLALKVTGLNDEASQRVLLEAFERKELTHKTFTAFRRIVDQRKYFGRKPSTRATRGSERSSADSLIAAYRHESQRQRLLVKKAKICEAKLLAASAAFRALITDEDYINLLRAEKMETMPRFLAEKAKAA